jgi:hypothetical protein
MGSVFVYTATDPTRGGGETVKYALVIYNNAEVLERRPEEERRRVTAGVAQVLERPSVTGWVRLRGVGSATTVRFEQGRTLLTDGPFVDSKDYLGGFIIVETDSLDGALAVAAELEELRGASACAIEVRPVNEEPLVA